MAMPKLPEMVEIETADGILATNGGRELLEAKTLLTEHFVVKVRKINSFDYGSISHRKRVVIVCIRRGSAYENDFEMPAPTWGGKRTACANDVAVSDETALAIMDTKYVYSGDLVTRYDLQEGHVTEDPTRWIPTSQPKAELLAFCCRV